MKKRLYRIATYLLIVIMMLTNLPLATAAPAEYGSLELTQTNPQFEGLELPLNLTHTAPLYFDGGEEDTYHTDPALAAAEIRDAMEARQESFIVGYSVSEKVPEDDEEKRPWFNRIAFDLLLEQAFEETQEPTEGDALRFCYYYMNLPIQYRAYSNRTDILFTYVPSYFTNAEQEAQLTVAVDELVEDFAFTDQTTEREKADTIYQWLCDNVDYDHDHSNDYYLKFSAYAAMIHKTAVCEGYAALFYRLAEEVGLDARVITGAAAHSGELHGWNIVRLGDSYYYLDATWDANVAPQDYAYYLRGDSDFYGHIVDEEYESAEFRARYPLAINGVSDMNGIELMLGDWKILIVGRSTAIILEYLGDDTDVTVPASFDLADYGVGSGVVPVESIETNAFSNRDPVNTTIESITISEGIRSLRPFAVSYCNNLKELHLPSTLQIKSYGFTSVTEVPVSCNNMETVTLAAGNPYLKLENGVLYTADGTTALYCPPKNGLETLTLPNGVENIGNEAFAHHATLRQVTLPSSVEEIGYFAFQTASKLEKITLNEGLDRIGQYAFHNCYRLQSIHLPASLRQILSGAFYETPLQTITVDAKNDVFSMQNGLLIGGGIVYKFALATQGEQVVVPAGVTEIDQGAFKGASFKGITLPSSLQEIGQTAFSDCENLLHVTIPENVTRIGDMAFSGCDLLLSVVIPAGVVRLGENIFHLGMPETYVTVFGEAGSKAQEYCAENNIEFKWISTFPCGTGHTVQKKEDTSNLYSYVWWWECEVCGCKTHTFTKLYSSIADTDITYALESETHIYDGTEFTPDVLWVKKGDTPLTEDVDYTVGYGTNLVPDGNNYIRLKGIGEFCGELFIPLTIERAPITSAAAVLDCYTFEYDGNAKYPAVLTLTLNGKELVRNTDFVTTYQGNAEVGTGYVVIRGNGNYSGEVRVPFTITPHQHHWGSWSVVDEQQHERKCIVAICEYYAAPQRADHQYDDEHDGICNDCGFTREISIANAVAVLNCYEFEYDGEPKYPAVLSLTLNGKTLINGVDFGVTYENNVQVGTAYVIIGGGEPYTGELRIPFTIAAHQHDWNGWFSCDNTQHYRYCSDTECENSRSWEYQPHQYDNEHDEVCNDCGYERTGTHSFTDNYQSDEQFHWLVCDGCEKIEGTIYGHSGGKATCQALAVCDDCGRSYGALGGCDWQPMMDDEYHWEKCTVCGDTTEKVKHSGGTATCTAQKNCENCGKAYGALAEHQWYKTGDAVNHWDQCFFCPAIQKVKAHSGPAPTTCGTQAICQDPDCTMPFGEPAGHSGGQATCTTQAFCQYCSTPYGSLASHQWEQRSGTTHHWMGCKNCTATQPRAAHSGGTATCKEQAVCTVCKKAYGGLKNHQWTNACDTECDVCKAPRTVSHQYGAYSYNNDATSIKDGTQTRTCSVCKATETVTATGTKLQNPFKDVKAGQYYTEPVLWAVGQGITNGTSANAFAPDATCTRGQIVTFLWRAAGSPEPQSTRNPFKDVKSNQYYYKAVLWAVEKGITTGTSANTFSPDAACTRGQVVTFLHRAQGKPAASGSNAFRDVKPGAYYYDAVRWAVKNGVTTGMSATSFAPDSPCTRGQIVTFLYRSHK